MAWFGQGKDTIEWEEFRDDVLFYKWKNNEIKKGAKLIIRPGQKAIFFAGGKVEGVFEETGTFDIATQITPFLSTLKGWFTLRGDSGMRAEVYFVNAKELLLTWGTRQRIMLPSPTVPSGIPVGCNGNLIIEFRDYLTFINKVAGIKSTFSLEDISERIMGEIGPIIAEAILDGAQSVSANAIIDVQRNSRKLSKHICQELDKELFDIGLGVGDVNIMSVNVPEQIQKMLEKVAAQSFVTDTGKYATIAMADGMEKGGNNMGAMAAQMAMGAQMAQQMMGSQQQPQQQPAAAPSGAMDYVCSECGKEYAQPAKFCMQCGKPVVKKEEQGAGSNFCPKCRKMVNGAFCPNCGTKTV